MTNFNLSPLFKSTVGFDRLFDLINSDFQSNNTGYPPYNIEVLGENDYLISMAIAGFKEDEIDITWHDGKLIVKGTRNEPNKQPDRKFLHRGIAERSFSQTFELADHVKVTDAKLENGILNITLMREVPETMKPKKIKVAS
ncbi:Hsp20 family protein [Thiotrichales bacterium 19S3-7]|nr:Hsp20 family protein [Thiotrichales bacterium 19S3-7]MCF6803045.1 Hsp20 family protein [Thiotrichales bacterium 19S3-11]